MRILTSRDAFIGSQRAMKTPCANFSGISTHSFLSLSDHIFPGE
jgi:hypothetical protein